MASTLSPNELNRSMAKIKPYYFSAAHDARIYKGNSLDLLPKLCAGDSPRVIFADPPYFLSGGGSTCHGGNRVSVNKGDWDKAQGIADIHAFNRRWLKVCQEIMHPDGTIWVSGTAHVIYSVGFAMQELGMKLLNTITWEKPNPPPNLSCRYFTHATETILWAARDSSSKHLFNYGDMKKENGGKQMKSVWRLSAPGKREKLHGKHPTQKPIALLDRILRASANSGDLVVDPFNGSGTTGVAALNLGMRYIGVDREKKYLDLSRSRLDEFAPVLDMAKDSA